jgi:hypothetical protein
MSDARPAKGKVALSPEDRGFTRGVAYAAAQIVRLHNSPVCAADVILESGIPAREFRAVVDGYDLSAIRRLARNETRLAEWWVAS